jgi:hypothetical protein
VKEIAAAGLFKPKGVFLGRMGEPRVLNRRCSLSAGHML